VDGFMDQCPNDLSGIAVEMLSYHHDFVMVAVPLPLAPPTKRGEVAEH
jgi:hypothetical protein